MAKKRVNLKLPKNLEFLQKKRNKKIIIGALAGLVVVMFLFYFKDWLVVAMVGNKPITRYQYNQELEKQCGEQVLETFVLKNLILDEAKNQGVVIGQARIDEQIKEIESQLELQGGDLDIYLESQGITRSELEEQIKIQLIIEEILSQEVKITEEDILQYYEENKEAFPEDSTFEELKPEISDQLVQQEFSLKYQPWVEELKAKAKVYYF